MPESTDRITAALLALWNNERQAFSSNLSKAVGDADADSFHDLRVAVKRMRALWRFVSLIDPAFDVRETRQAIGQVFRAAGAVRDLQVQLELVRDMADAGVDVERWLVAIKEKEIAAYIAFVPVVEGWSGSSLDNVELAIAESTSGVPVAVASIVTAGASRDSVAKVASWRKRHPRGDLHELRREAKETGYRLFIWKTVFGADLLPTEVSLELDAVQKWLGKWHDHEVARDVVRADRQLCLAVHDGYVLLLRRKRAARMRVRRRLEKFSRAAGAALYLPATKSEIARPTSAA